MTKKVMIVGLGLIGGSLALGIRRAHPEIEILGVDRPETLAIAADRELIDRPSALTEAVAADVVILAVPITQILVYLRELSALGVRALVTDTGSTKAEIVRLADKLGLNFVGGHPMAGSHKSGVNAADVNLFEHAYFLLTADSELLKELYSGLGAKFMVVDAQTHDRVMSQVSHFPHLLASTLVMQLDGFSSNFPLTKKLSAGGFRDMTRIAASEPAMWASILLSNREAVLSRLTDFKAQLTEVESLVAAADSARLTDYLTMSRQVRETMEILPGNSANNHLLYISIPDEKGATLRVLALLSDISIANVKLNENNREDIHGQLQISFKTRDDLARAKELIALATNFSVIEG
ncbi:MAG: prephenate dehydrogenase [Streptococcaceae bacterium]|jgi:prephenate dehydrogenase|nr:prephenate dehydrogenase [Streptococcaceae bacterium]